MTMSRREMRNIHRPRPSIAAHRSRISTLLWNLEGAGTSWSPGRNSPPSREMDGLYADEPASTEEEIHLHWGRGYKLAIMSHARDATGEQEPDSGTNGSGP